MIRRKIILVCALILLPALFGNQHYALGNTDDLQETYKNLEVFSNVLSITQQNYVDDIDTKEALEGAIKGLLTSLDPHSSFLKPQDFK